MKRIPEAKNERVQVRLTRAQVEVLRLAAKRRGLDLATWMREIALRAAAEGP